MVTINTLLLIVLINLKQYSDFSVKRLSLIYVLLIYIILEYGVQINNLLSSIDP